MSLFFASTTCSLCQVVEDTITETCTKSQSRSEPAHAQLYIIANTTFLLITGPNAAIPVDRVPFE
jgi:hypothetical protein